MGPSTSELSTQLRKSRPQALILAPPANVVSGERCFRLTGTISVDSTYQMSLVRSLRHEQEVTKGPVVKGLHHNCIFTGIPERGREFGYST